MKKSILLLLAVLLFNSCKIQKESAKTKTDRTVSEVTEKTFKRRGDTVSYVVPKITYKDTTIYTVNRQGTILKTIYDNSGQISNIDCISSLIEVTERSNKLMQEFIKDKNKKKTEKSDTLSIIFIVVAVGVLLFFVIKLLR